MNWLDSLIGFISPEKGYERMQWRTGLDLMRDMSYDAGNYMLSNQNWRVMNQSAEMTDRYSRETVRARARDLERNSDIFNAVVGAYKRNVIGGGYRLQARTADEELNDRIEQIWKKWCKKQYCDVTGTQSLNQMLRMAIERKKVDGGILILKRYVQGGMVPLKLQAVEVDELDGCQILPKNQGNKVVGGIELNNYNKPVGYWIRQYDLSGGQMMQPIFVDAKDVIFLYSKKRPSQVREMSDMAPTITRTRNVNEFMEAVSVKERIAACLAVFIKRKLPTSGIGRGLNDETKNRKSYDGKMLVPGMIKELNQGDEVETVNPSGQATDSTAFVKLQQRLIGAGQGISYEAASRDMSETNYSSARQGSIEDDMTYAEEKELFMELMDEIYESFLISGYLSGIFLFPDFWERKDEYMRHTWIQAPKKWIDPAKEANANKIALQTGQKTLQQIAAENGKDWKEQVDEIIDVIKYAEEKGVDLGGVLFGKSVSVQKTE